MPRLKRLSVADPVVISMLGLALLAVALVFGLRVGGSKKREEA